MNLDIKSFKHGNETFLNYNPSETNEQYHSSSGLSNSGLKLFSKTPKHYHIGRHYAETGGQRLGTLTHMALLENARFKKGVKAVAGHRGGKEVKAEIQHWEDQGFYVCKPDEYIEAERMADGILSQPKLAALLEKGNSEVSFRGLDPRREILRKCRPDRLNVESGIVVDVKTFSDLSIRNLERQIHRMRYHWQSADYLDILNYSIGLKTDMFVHLFVDTDAYTGRAVVLDNASLEKAREEMSPVLDQYAECMRTNNWPGYPDQIEEISLPSYGWNE